ncbi:PREDICTED: pleckstrin homology domain-containing family G member 3-like [Nipponia nippon]|uniref:pleckstrin homology domain-containing family G member 3-like n=1 Tax=Nipponia nippon TaxID=128390 RepID=UPI000510AD81|nr:PREDICTED: pleckstrin homology domain-containing family G member 3-like [Nipponia nippon]
MALVPLGYLFLREHGPRLLGRIARLWDPPCALPVPGDAGMPVPTCLQHPALSPVPEPGRAMEEPAGDGAEPWAEGLRNSNNNASPGGWPGARGGHPLAPFGGPGAEPSYLGRVVLEIVESERTYARDLRSIVEGYLGKIIDAEEPVLRPEQVSALFGNIEDIYELSRAKPQARFPRECQERLRHALPLGAYLLKPVQRILKYHLLLQEIAKHFEHKSGDDYEVVLEAIDTMTCVAWYINDMKRKHEHAIRQQEIQSLLLGWKGPDLTSYGELVLEGTFRVQRVRHERAVFLFDKTLLITKRRGDHYVYKSHIPCSSLMLIESTRDSLCFSLAHYKHGKQQHSLQAKSVEEKRLWTHHIKRLILENHHAIIPQKAKEAILEMDLFYPPRLPRCSPEHLKKSWSCQPLGDTAAELRQGRRQSEPFEHRDRTETLPDQLHGHMGRRQSGADAGLKRSPPSSTLAATGLSWRWGSPPSTPEPGQRLRTWWRRKKRKRKRRRRLWAGSTAEHPVGLGAPEAPSSAGTPVPVLPGGEGEQERAAEDLQGLSSEEEEEEEEDGAADSILPPSIRSPTTREKICLKAVVERCKAYQASEEYRRRCPEPPDTPEPPRHGLVRNLRQKFQTLDTAS